MVSDTFQKKIKSFPNIDEEAIIRWRAYFKGPLHRDDGPAYELEGYQSWFVMGERHRVDGPAQEWEEGDCRWYLNGKRQWPDFNDE